MSTNEYVFNKVMMILGRRTSGKTLFVKGSEEFNQEGFFRSYLDRGMKILIIDTIDHPSYSDIPVIKLEDLANWKRGIYRIWVRAENIPDLCKYLNEIDSLWNTLIIFEDAYKHSDKTLCMEIKTLIIDSKQKNIDIIFFYHAWGWAPKDLFRCLDLLEIFKTKDDPTCRKDDMPGYYEDALRVYKQVKEHASKYHHQLIDTEL